MRTKHDTLWDKFWRDDHGDVVVWQTPNYFIIGWALLTFVSLFLNGTISSLFVWLGIASLIVWSCLEILQGVNYFRRTLGAVVLVLIILSVIHIA